MEQPSQRTTGRSLAVGRPATATQGRPLSADDIQKAKMRAQFMQSKYGKAKNDESSLVKPEAPNGVTSPQDDILQGAPKLQGCPKDDEHEKLDSVALKGSNQQESHRKLSFDVEEPPWKRCRRMQIPWCKPPGKFAFVFTERLFLLTCRSQKRRNISFVLDRPKRGTLVNHLIFLGSRFASKFDEIRS